MTPTQIRIKRCWNLKGGVCFNDEEKGIIASMLVDELTKAGIVSANDRAKAISTVTDNSKVMSSATNLSKSIRRLKFVR